ncbi:MAG: hypothetical protein H6973_10115 [Gammaproteobacteria bacterium]|nr:hypothetical protein [Gammaproteobacteria bacterium]
MLTSSNGLHRPTKITPHHLERRAMVYIRQSSAKQVRDHVGSQINQRVRISLMPAIHFTG